MRTKTDVVITLIFLLLIAVVDGCYNQVVYGDWTCLAKHCVVVK